MPRAATGTGHYLVLALARSMELITWLVVGLVAGLLASALMRGSGFGVLGDIALGIGGAFVGGWAFRELGWHAPFAGLAGVIVVAFIGACIVLLGLRMLRVATTRRP
jgi:uncharacterized membrane protein YeaQ/YmgE (transglycosylase-associated protein family)